MASGTLKRWLTVLLTLPTVFGNPISSTLPCPSSAPSPPALGVGKVGAVASESEICSHIGIDLLKLGGNAADAMVGTVACIGVVGMYHSGKLLIMAHERPTMLELNTDGEQVSGVSKFF
jgi:gamma-glutamyltranspeptidase/glutathione hydrolase